MDASTTANDAYRAARERIDRQIGQINHLVRAHAEKQSADPKNWGFAGDLSRLVEQLNEAIECFGGGREEKT